MSVFFRACGPLRPLASEAPAIAIAVLFVLSGQAASGLSAMLSDKINHWTLLVGMLPLAMLIGAGAVTYFPLDPRQHEEFFLTAAQSLFGVALLPPLRLGIPGALALIVLFVLQLALAFVYRNNEAATIASLTGLGWFYIALAAVLVATRFSHIRTLMRTALLPSARSS